MSQQERIPDSKYLSGIKSIIKRDLFPELKNDAVTDPTLQVHNLTSYCQAYTPKSEAEFFDSIEMDRKKLKNAAPSFKYDEKKDNTKFNPWPYHHENALFFDPKPIQSENRKALTYKTRKPTINYRMVNFENAFLNPASSNYSSYHPFTTTESSTTDTDSEFEGRNVFRNTAILPNAEITQKLVKAKFEKRKKLSDLSEKGREIFKSLQSQD